MARLNILAIALAMAFACTSVNCSNESFDVEHLAAHNLTDLFIENQGLKLEDAVKKVIINPINQMQTIVYSFGRRLNGDWLLATDQASQDWSSAKDYTLTLRYPKAGTAKVATFLKVTVQQSSNVGQAYVTSGGIGNRFIEVKIEAKNTLYFKYDAQIYGY